MVPDRHFEGHDDPRCHEALSQIADAAIRHSTLPELTHEFVQRLHRFFQFEIAGSCLHDPIKNVMRFTVWEGAGAGQFSTELPIEGSTCGWVWQRQLPLILNDLVQEHRFTESLDIEADGRARDVCSAVDHGAAAARRTGTPQRKRSRL